MIFVCVGASRPFDRLIKRIDEVADKGLYSFLCQIGPGKYVPEHVKYFRFLAHHEMIRTIAGSELVITHGGFGTIFDCLKLGTRIISIPKTFKFDETDNDQTETVRYLESRGVLSGVYDLEELESKMKYVLNDEVNIKSLEFNSDIGIYINNFILKNK